MVNKKKKNKVKKSYKKKQNKEVDDVNRGQVWSIDVLLGVVIFISIILVFYVTIGSNQSRGVETLEADALNLKTGLEQNHDLGFLQEDIIDEAKLENFINEAEINYNKTKEKLGIRGEFCIFFEDENGNLILLQSNKTGIGSTESDDSNKVMISGIPCGEAYP